MSISESKNPLFAISYQLYADSVMKKHEILVDEKELTRIINDSRISDNLRGYLERIVHGPFNPMEKFVFQTSHDDRPGLEDTYEELTSMLERGIQAAGYKVHSCNLIRLNSIENVGQIRYYICLTFGWPPRKRRITSEQGSTPPPTKRAKTEKEQCDGCLEKGIDCPHGVYRAIW